MAPCCDASPGCAWGCRSTNSSPPDPTFRSPAELPVAWDRADG